MNRLTYCATSTLAAVLLTAAPQAATAQQTLSIWWEKGFYKAEDDALAAVLSKFEKKYNVKTVLSQYPAQDMLPKTAAALDSGTVPDVVFSNVFDFQATGKWAYEGKLENISDVINPIRSRFAPNTVETTFLYNGKTQSRAYYAFPIRQQTMHIQYWRDALTDAGFKDSDIPRTWKDYWSFWCDKVQPASRKKTGTRSYATGFPMGVDSTDSMYSFLTFMDAYGVKLVNDSGKLLVDDPAVRKGMVGALTDYTAVHSKGCTPPSSTNWKDPDNNVAFANKTILLTHNGTISIAAKWLDDANNPALPEAQRAQAKKNYDENVATSGFPSRPDGGPMIYRASVKTGVVFAAAKNKDLAKKFVSFLMEEQNLTPYIEGSLGRWYPVTKAGQESPFWQADPHRRAVYQQFKAGTVPFEFTKNYRFTLVNNENVWAKAMNRVVNENVPVEQAVDEMLARIKTLAGN